MSTILHHWVPMVAYELKFLSHQRFFYLNRFVRHHIALLTTNFLIWLLSRLLVIRVIATLLRWISRGCLFNRVFLSCNHIKLLLLLLFNNINLKAIVLLFRAFVGQCKWLLLKVKYYAVHFFFKYRKVRLELNNLLFASISTLIQ